uniref:Retrotransposon protein, putative, Ty3-gypsy subclass n=1 Tax=Oryza sativa subsp. japonica TaxID=39947 RepID=Q33AS6_ORYSJ|nr:retrotransposon protein, putative, Ty3-gypsy subclass [Oryza sativa Japonica Group]
MDLGTSTSTNASLKKLQEDGALPGHGVMEREVGGTEPQPVLGHMVAIKDYILCGFLPPPSEFLLLVLNFYGLSLLHLNPNSIAFLSIFPHLCEAYIGVEPFLDLFRFYYELRWMESNRVSRCVGFRLQDGLSSATVECRVGQLMISGPTTASDIPVPLCEKEATEREAAINALPLTDVIGPLADHQAAASLKESVAREMSDVAAAAATSGSRVPKMRRTFTSVLGSRRKASSPPARAAQDRSGGASRASPAAASTDVVVVSKSREAMPSGPSSGLGPTRGPPADVLTWEELQAEMKRILEAGTRGISCEIKRRRQWQRHRRTSVPTSCNTTWRRLARTSRK